MTGLLRPIAGRGSLPTHSDLYKRWSTPLAAVSLASVGGFVAAPLLMADAVRGPQWSVVVSAGADLGDVIGFG